MPKTDVKRPESKDVRELADEALDRSGNELICICGGACGSGSPTE